MEKKLKDRFSISELLQRFPSGFAVSSSGRIYEIVSSLPMPDRPGWGQLIAKIPELKLGDEKMFEDEIISIDEFHQKYTHPMPLEPALKIQSTLKVDSKRVLIRESMGGYELYLE